MPYSDPDKLAYTFKNLPCRRPRGSVENVIRAFMFPLLYKGLSRDAAEWRAIVKARELGENVENLSLRYREE